MILVMEANSAMAPMMRMIIGWPSPPTTMIEPTTAMAEIALVSDMRGVCKSRETRRITPPNFYWLPAKLSTIAWDKVKDTAFAPIATFEDLTALQQLPRVRLSATAKIEGSDQVRVTIHNPTKNLAFQVHVGIRGANSEDEILPVLWEDNYISLMPGQSKTLTARYLKKDVLGKNATLVVDGWNVEPVTARVN